MMAMCHAFVKPPGCAAPLQVWGWLVPGSRQLPYVLLKGNGVAIGRGREALWASSSATSTQQPSPRAFLTAGSERK
jgi:hypothetical protein